MKRITIFLLLCAFIIACKKEDKVDEVTYEVTLVNSTTWHGAYFNENAEVVGVTNAPSGWTYKFKNINKLTAVNVTAYADGLSASADCNMKIYVNGTVVASGKSSSSPQVQYVFP